MSEVNTYIQDVLSGKRIAGKWIKLVLQRHLDDVAKQDDPSFPYFFDEDTGNHPINLIEEFIIPPGSSELMRLLPWEKTYVQLLYGWLRKSDGLRRFQHSLLFMAKKNGKTGLAAGLSIHNLLADGDPTARVVIAATTMGQGKECLSAAAMMRMSSPFLREQIQQTGGKKDIRYVTALSHGMARVSVMARDAASEDGARVTHCIIDELHRWKTKLGLYSILRYGTRTCKQPLMIEITTAGDAANKESPCWEEYEYATKVLDPADEKTDDTFLPFLYVMDEGDDWQEENNWYKSNPSMGPMAEGYLLDLDTLRKEYTDAKGKPGEVGIFKRFALNLWHQEAEEPAIDIAEWDACCRVNVNTRPDPIKLREQTEKELEGRVCFGGLDTINLPHDLLCPLNACADEPVGARAASAAPNRSSALCM